MLGSVVGTIFISLKKEISKKVPTKLKKSTGIKSIRFIIKTQQKTKRARGATTYNLQPTTYNLQPTTYNLQPTTYNLQPTTYNLQPTTYNLQP
jgi:hypothetical protein